MGVSLAGILVTDSVPGRCLLDKMSAERIEDEV
jgi:hypothetical protein